MKKLLVILSVVILLGFSFFCIDSSRVKNDSPPLFVIKTVIYRDGGTTEYLGLGYKVIKYNVIGENGKIVKDDYKIGSYFLKS